MTELVFPWPPPQLFPNFKRSHHWSAYHKHARNARTLGWGLTAQVIGPKLRQFEAPEKIKIRVTATPPMRGGRLPDEDGLKGALKHYLDGIADALGVDDKRFRFAEMEWRDKAGNGAIRIEFDD